MEQCGCSHIVAKGGFTYYTEAVGDIIGSVNKTFSFARISGSIITIGSLEDAGWTCERVGTNEEVEDWPCSTMCLLGNLVMTWLSDSDIIDWAIAMGFFVLRFQFVTHSSGGTRDLLFIDKVACRIILD